MLRQECVAEDQKQLQLIVEYVYSSQGPEFLSFLLSAFEDFVPTDVKEIVKKLE